MNISLSRALVGLRFIVLSIVSTVAIVGCSEGDATNSGLSQSDSQPDSGQAGVLEGERLFLDDPAVSSDGESRLERSEGVEQRVTGARRLRLLASLTSADCCGEDAHPVHGVVTGDGSLIVVGKSLVNTSNAGFVSLIRAGDEATSGENAVDLRVAASKILAGDSALVSSAVFGNYVIVAGFQAASSSAPYSAIALVLDADSLETQAILSIPGSEEEGSALFESVLVSPNGDIQLGGARGFETSGLEGLKSFGNVRGGEGFLVQTSLEEWLDAGTEASFGNEIRETSMNFSEIASIKSLAATSNGSFALIGQDENERSRLVIWNSKTGDVTSEALYAEYEITDIASVQGAPGEELLVITGHGGSRGIDGYVQALTTEGQSLWSQTFGNMLGSEGESGVADRWVFDECWGIGQLEDSIIAACGSGIESCSEVDSENQDKCRQDSRQLWRSYLVGLSLEGELISERAEYLDADMAGESAAEYVAIGDGWFYSIVDQNVGLGVGLYTFEDDE